MRPRPGGPACADRRRGGDQILLDGPQPLLEGSIFPSRSLACSKISLEAAASRNWR